MELKKVEISNYKSIKNITMSFTPSCRVLVGINESGKTNVITALAHLDIDRTIDQLEVREPSPDEGEVTEAYIKYVFELDKTDHESILDAITSDMLFSKDEWILEDENQKYKAKDLLQFFPRAQLTVNLIKGRKYTQYFTVNRSFKVNSRWKKINDSAANTVIDSDIYGETSIDNYKFVITNSEENFEPYVDEIDSEDVLEHFGEHIIDYLRNNLPGVVYWQYNSDYLLPGSIELEAFKANPEICLPLKNMFELSGIKQISDALTTAESKSMVSLRNLLNRVAETTTKHLRKVWKEYRNIKIELNPNGKFIEASIKDEFNNYEFSKRSDGFKRFVSFLLFVSIKNATTDLSGDLILVDEPEIGLHPSGAKFLRDELLKISKTNKVVFSTHSIFMIDRENIDRHLIVKKTKEVTNVENVEEGNLYDEEVIFNALGSSVYESLKEVNIIFEGWRDKQLFKTALDLLGSGESDLKKILSNVGVCHSKGAKYIKNITPLLEMANKKCFIISDSDQVSKEEKAKYDGYGVWYTYDNIDNTLSDFTGEDFLTVESFKKPIKSLEGSFKGSLQSFDFEQLNTPGNRIRKIEDWLRTARLGKETIKNEINDLKSSLFDDLKKANIDESYLSFLRKLGEKIKNSEH